MATLWVLLALACTSDTDETDIEDLDPATVSLAGVCEMADDFGGFSVDSSADGAGVQGAVADGVVPITVLEEIVAEAGCRLLRRNNPHCEPACDAGQTCDFDGTCLPYPSNQDLGVVKVHGLAQPVEMEPVFPGNTYYDTSLPDPPFVPGELVTLSMPGGVYGPVTLHGVGVEPLEVEDEEWKVEATKDLQVTWSAPAGAVVRSQVALTISIDQHGASPGSLHCLFEDTGAGTVPSNVIDRLVESGVTGFPSGALERRTADHAMVDDGCLDLTVAMPLVVPVDVVGFTPCVGDEDCPEGMECNEEMQICEPVD